MVFILKFNINKDNVNEVFQIRKKINYDKDIKVNNNLIIMIIY